MLATKGYGWSVADIDESCPADLQPYASAYMLERKYRDMEAWMQWGAYGLSAVATAIEHNLAGKKAKSKYVKHPVIGKDLDGSNRNVESDEECAVYEMKQRIRSLEMSGLPQSPD